MATKAQAKRAPVAPQALAVTVAPAPIPGVSAKRVERLETLCAQYDMLRLQAKVVEASKAKIRTELRSLLGRRKGIRTMRWKAYLVKQTHHRLNRDRLEEVLGDLTPFEDEQEIIQLRVNKVGI